METLKFKTNIKCSGCVAKSTPFLNEAAGEDNWEVDVHDPNKILTIATEDKVDPQAIVKAVENAGFKAEKIA
ncbi:MAG TPA: heavy metal transport/detoxification protein [Flavisolibacter sp.]|jgi:copper chaperone CopZ|nr:heavy metal transport/detoxification protein [Flavisolibacter sp.]